jgi:RNA recognition motif-containing protein
MHIFIENLPDDVTEEKLRDLFEDFVRPAKAEIDLHFDSGHPTFATLHLDHLTQQTAAVLASHFDKRWFGGKFIRVHATQFD